MTRVQPDYSRQEVLREVGPRGQAALAAAKVLVIGAGGLGSPVLQYLAGAGVGCLGIVDADLLEASNLHRQPIFSLGEIGHAKAELAAAAVRRINPTVNVRTHITRLDAGNALALVSDYDLVIDCSDNFRTKFLINDAAVLAKRPAVFASVYQYEGQLQVYKPEASHACLRCLWPQATADGVVGNCAEAGVLGPIPGTFGALQGLLALKVILQLPGQLAGELLLLDFANFSSIKLKASRLAVCLAPQCAHIRSIANGPDGLEIALGSLAEAGQRGLTVIDIRNDEEVAQQPSGVRQIPMHKLMTDPDALPAGDILLLCASGKRSLAAARELTSRGFAVHSLAGGLKGMRR